MSAILQDISEKLQKGKMKEVAELVKQAVADGIQPLTILNEGLMPGMDIIGERFKKNDIFIPEVLIAARAMPPEPMSCVPSSWAPRWKKRAPSSSGPSRTTSTTSARTLSA